MPPPLRLGNCSAPARCCLGSGSAPAAPDWVVRQQSAPGGAIVRSRRPVIAARTPFNRPPDSPRDRFCAPLSSRFGRGEWEVPWRRGTRPGDGSGEGDRGQDRDLGQRMYHVIIGRKERSRRTRAWGAETEGVTHSRRACAENVPLRTVSAV